MRLPTLRPDQTRIARHPAKTKVLACGRRWGKTVLGGVLSSVVLGQHGKVAWVAPTYKNARPLWRWLMNAFADEIRATNVRANKQDLTLETKFGGYLGLYSGDNIDSLRGDFFNLVVGDEAARLTEYAVYDVIMPTLADFDGDLLLISTPKGKNWFFREWSLGQQMNDDVVKSWTAPTSDNPMPSIRRAAELARTRVPELTYLQEWEAQFIDAGMVFRNIDACTRIFGKQEPDREKGSYIIGVDWGKHEDFTVFIVFDVRNKAVVAVERSNRVDYTIQVERLAALRNWWSAETLVVESTTQSDAIIEMLYARDLPVVPIRMDQATKIRLIEQLQIAFQFETISIPDDPILKGELIAYEAERLPSGKLRYGAPRGLHDDTVMALALAWDYGRYDDGPGLEPQEPDPLAANWGAYTKRTKAGIYVPRNWSSMATTY